MAKAKTPKQIALKIKQLKKQVSNLEKQKKKLATVKKKVVKRNTKCFFKTRRYKELILIVKDSTFY